MSLYFCLGVHTGFSALSDPSPALLYLGRSMEAARSAADGAGSDSSILGASVFSPGPSY
jgi:hypothetical protein